MNINLPEREKLNTQNLQRLFDNMSECYKLFWFQAIVEHVLNGKVLISYDSLLNTMIANAWYMVNEYKLNLGPSDTLEALVLDTQKHTGLKSSEKKETIISVVRDLTDSNIIEKKRVLTYNVPYRLQSPFLSDIKGDKWRVNAKKLSTIINEHEDIIYRFDNINGLKSTIRVEPTWEKYICDNAGIIQGWIEYNMILYLQRRNPSVPGIPNKLKPPQERNLEKVRSLWVKILDVKQINDIYSEQLVDPKNLSIDHFIPWSYVAHDELWNLNPTTKNINSKKSNNLPDWDLYFPRLQKQEYLVYEALRDFPEIQYDFEKCSREHINSLDVRRKLYSSNLSEFEFCKNLEEIVQPVYNSAKNMGFENWIL